MLVDWDQLTMNKWCVGILLSDKIDGSIEMIETEPLVMDLEKYIKK